MGGRKYDEEYGDETPSGMWHGPTGRCGFCKCDLEEEKYFVDGATVHGPWANMCDPCHGRYGKGIGLGYGQRYLKVGLEWIKTSG